MADGHKFPKGFIERLLGGTEMTEQLEAVCARTFESLDRATRDGYDNVLLNSAGETAAEIGEYDSKLAGLPTTLLAQIVQVWLTARSLSIAAQA